jgi:peptide/nickel transport system substrate-binding protein
VDPYPTGDQLFATGSGSNFANYSSPSADGLISGTVHASTSLTSYENYMAENVPVIWMPMPVYQLSEIAANLRGATPQSPIESLTPENWSFSK